MVTITWKPTNKQKGRSFRKGKGSYPTFFPSWESISHMIFNRRPSKYNSRKTEGGIKHRAELRDPEESPSSALWEPCSSDLQMCTEGSRQLNFRRTILSLKILTPTHLWTFYHLTTDGQKTWRMLDRCEHCRWSPWCSPSMMGSSRQGPLLPSAYTAGSLRTLVATCGWRGNPVTQNVPEYRQSRAKRSDVCSSVTLKIILEIHFVLFPTCFWASFGGKDWVVHTGIQKPAPCSWPEVPTHRWCQPQ